MSQERSLLIDTSADIFVVGIIPVVDKDIIMKGSNVNILTANNRKLKCLGHIEEFVKFDNLPEKIKIELQIV